MSGVSFVLCAIVGVVAVLGLWVWAFVKGAPTRAAWRTPRAPLPPPTGPPRVEVPIDPDYALRVVATAYRRWQQYEAQQAATWGARMRP